ncbi:hypothetical protein C9374_011993 [Naegleria lovaniensis]|uniref:T-cell immunomodulatory protein TIP C2 domain-containing protein n=1 Tax=Naegleria lovaniensis TaxID=51637 RepID=A0AA88G886_NAELO|nr:uncharacterized protein C9374_011993 [Naegleria lovaniensis]KAG2373530.1 hypothetical protein C9374_011993 [Naegleria lovaniensis]
MIFLNIISSPNSFFLVEAGIKLFPPSFSHAPSFLFRESILYDVSSNVGFNEIEGRIEALGDFANQQHTDLVVSSKNRKQIIIYTWDTYQWKFINYTSFDYETSSKFLAHTNVEIVNIVASDFNFDGALDLLVTLIDKDNFDNNNPSYIHSILVGNFKTLREEKMLDEKTTDQLLIFDLNGDLLPDLFGTDFTTKKRTYWLNNNTNYEAGQLSFIRHLQDSNSGFTTIDSVTKTPPASTNLNPLAFPISTASIDLDGDCGSDLFVMSCSKQDTHGFCEEPIFEFWVNYKGILQLNSTLNAPKGAGRPVFIDVDHDGDLDMLYPVCYPIDSCSEVNEIHILYNNQLALCKSIVESNCRSSSNLCLKSNFDFNQKAVLSFPKDDNANKKRILHHYIKSDKYKSSPPSLRAGDFNLDGYPDLVVSIVESVEHEENGIEESYQMVGVELWQNVECKKETIDDALSLQKKSKWFSESSHFSRKAANDDESSISTTFKCDSNATPRTFQVVTKGVDALKTTFVKLPYNSDMNDMPFYDAFFLDIDETGILDIITLYNDPKSGNQTLRAFFNCFYNDAYFLKVISTNGVAPDGTQYYYGVNAPSMTVKFVSTKLNGEYQLNMNSLLSQTSYLSLQTPYHLFGIGRTNGYIEEFFIGRVMTNSSTTTNYYEASAIMPNSQLVTITTPPEDTDSWQVQLFVNPSAAALWVIIAEVVSLILLFIPIAILFVREYRHDKKEKEETSREISSVFI